MNTDSDDQEITITQAASALFRLGRLFGRLGMPSAVAGHTAHAVELSRILVVQAIESVEVRGEQEATIGVVAQQLGVEQSTASRLIADTIRDGYVARAASLIDNRRVQLELTDTGRVFAQNVQAYQVEVFRQITSGWQDTERETFARLFVQFAEAVASSVQTQSTDKKRQPGAQT